MKFFPISLASRVLLCSIFVHTSAFSQDAEAVKEAPELAEKAVEAVEKTPEAVEVAPVDDEATPAPPNPAAKKNLKEQVDDLKKEVPVVDESTDETETTDEAQVAPEKKDMPEEAKEETKVVEKPEEDEKKTSSEMQILGWKEWIWAVNPDHIFRAKLDTGARTCSIHATNIETFESDGEKWVQFTISDPRDGNAPRLRHKAPVLRVAKIKNDVGGLDERIVVPLTFQIGKTKLEAEFNLNNREDMICPILLGRNVLKYIGYVDASRIDTLKKPKAKTATPPKEPAKK